MSPSHAEGQRCYRRSPPLGPQRAPALVHGGSRHHMCGIVGYVGRRQARDLLLAGLQKLEYRGYDSAGISVLRGDVVESVRAVGNLANLHAAVAEQGDVVVASTTATATKATGSTGVGH